MSVPRHSKNISNVAAIGLGLAFALTAVVAGLMVTIVPYWIIFAAAAIPIFFFVVAWRIEYGVLAVLALVSGIVHEAFLPSLSFLRAGDLAFFAVGLIVIVSGYKMSNGFQPGELKLWIPLAAFLLLVPVSVVNAHYFNDVTLKNALGEGRPLMYLLLLPMLVAVLNTKERLHRFLVGLVLLGVLFSFGQVLQGVFHVRVFGDSGSMSIAQTLNVKSYDATISKTGGLNIIIFVLFLSAGWYTQKSISAVKFLAVSALLASGILLTFGRTTWGATLFGLIVVVYLLGLRKSGPMLILGLMASTLALVTLVAVKPAMLDALVVRATSVGSEIDHGSSAGWRYYEVDEIVPKIIASPVLGLGLGAAYRRSALSDVLPEQVRYIHNGYLYMVSKLGAPAFLLFIWCMLVVLTWSWRGTKTEPDPILRAVHAAICAGIIGMFLASVTEPHFMRDSSVAYLAVTAALSVVLKRHSGKPATAVKQTTFRAGVRATAAREIAGKRVG